MSLLSKYDAQLDHVFLVSFSCDSISSVADPEAGMREAKKHEIHHLFLQGH